jgi:hypothetical protein
VSRRAVLNVAGLGTVALVLGVLAGSVVALLTRADPDPGRRPGPGVRSQVEAALVGRDGTVGAILRHRWWKGDPGLGNVNRIIDLASSHADGLVFFDDAANSKWLTYAQAGVFERPKVREWPDSYFLFVLADQGGALHGLGPRRQVVPAPFFGPTTKEQAAKRLLAALDEDDSEMLEAAAEALRKGFDELLNGGIPPRPLPPDRARGPRKGGILPGIHEAQGAGKK